MAEVTGVIGNQPVELDNAATEKTLRDLLAAVNRLNGNIISRTPSNTQSGANSASNPASSAATAVASSFGLLGVAITAIRGTFNVLSGVVSGLTSVVSATSGALISFSNDAIEGQTSLSKFYGQLEGLVNQIPIVGGVLGSVVGLFTKLAELQEAELVSYRKLTDAGTNFGGSLTTIRSNALSLGMTLDQYTGFVVKHSKALSLMGDNANEGATAFTSLAKGMQDSAIGTKLRGLGYDAESMSEGLANYIAMSGGRTAAEMKDSKALSAAAGEYMSQLDMLSQITGKQRSQLEEQMAEESKNAAYQAYLQTLDEDGRKKATIAMQNALAVGGKAGADILKSQMLGLPPMTEAAQKLTALGPNVAAGIKGMADAVSDTKKSTSDVNKKFAEAQVGASKDMEKYGKSAQALSFGSDAVSGALMGMAAQANRNRDQGIRTVEDAQRQQDEIAKKQADRAISTASAAAETEKGFKDINQSIYALLKPAIEVLTPLINDLAMKFLEFSKEHMGDIQQSFELLINSVFDFSKKLFSPEGRQEIINDLRDGFRIILKELAKQLNITVQNESERAQQQLVDQSNWEKMSIGEKIESGIGRGLESAIGIVSSSLKEQAEGARIRAETEYFANNPPKRATGSLGMTGKLFENWGSGTMAELHGMEAVVTPGQMADIVKNAATGAAKSLTGTDMDTSSIDNLIAAFTSSAPGDKLTEQITRLNTLSEQMLNTMKETTSLMKKNVDATQSLRGNLFA